MKKFKAGIIGATGYVGQRFVTLLDGHPWFELSALFASKKSAGLTYEQAVSGRWKLSESIPEMCRESVVHNTADIASMADELDLVFCAVDMPKDELIKLEENIAKLELPVISNNSANRWQMDVPMLIPEINPQHSRLIQVQRRRLGTKRGFIVCKPNCSIQTYVPALTPLLEFRPQQLMVSTYQAISGAGKTFTDWPEMNNNLIPYIPGEEEKSEREPLKIWGKLAQDTSDHIIPAEKPIISAQCYRVAVQEGHTASVAVKFAERPSLEQIISAWENYHTPIKSYNLPSAPVKFLTYHQENDRPQPRLDIGLYAGMGISLGRLREDNIMDYKFTCLSHNTLRGAAGGAVLTAELLIYLGYIS